MTSDLVVLLDSQLRPAGTAARSTVHTENTPLHWAFSVYLFDADDRLLVTRRALAKRTWPGVWTNSCCGHVRPGERPEESARRRVREELGLEASEWSVLLPDFRYRAVSAEGLVENEVCPVFVARVASDPVPAEDEVCEWRWTPWARYRAAVESAPWLVSPWSALQVAQMSGAVVPPVA